MAGFPGDWPQCRGPAHAQNALILAIAAANPKTIVVASVPGAIVMPWKEQVDCATQSTSS